MMSQKPQQPQMSNVTVNPVPPIDMGGVMHCPLCQAQITGPFAAVTAENKTVKKWGCTNQFCHYVWKIEGGNFKNVFEANPVAFG